MIFDKIPHERPSTPMLDSIDTPADLRLLSERELKNLADELRHFLLYSVGQTGGHFAAGLGVIELTLALHYVFDTPDDRLIWDVGHQAYPHKIITGRRDQMLSMRKKGGISAFPKRDESEYDSFGVGHSSTSISAALGMAIAAKNAGIKRKHVAIIGDGAMTAGMAFEALNHAPETGADMLVVLNDNDMSISQNVGGLSQHLARLLSSRTYSNMREGSKRILSLMPGAWELARKTEEHAKNMLAPSILFEELGWNYIGPVDGHDLPTLLATLRNMRDLRGPQFLHVITKKGKGLAPAEVEPIKYHAINPHDHVADKSPRYSHIFGRWLCDMAAADERLFGITPAMKEGSDLIAFSEQFPERYFDVAIAEQHAVTLAAGMACEGGKPVVAIYSTFLQRAYDQLIHDVAVQNLDVLFAIDRAGLVGEDGATHAGSFDLSYMRCIPNLLIMTPSDENELRLLLNTGYHYNGPAAVRYPRGTGPDARVEDSLQAVAIGKAVVRRQGKDIAILVFGNQLANALKAAGQLDATVVDMRFVKPLDETMISEIAASHHQLVSVEENTIVGGAGSAVAEYLHSQRLNNPLLMLGLPDRYVEQGDQTQMLADCGLSAEGILASIQSLQSKLTR